MKSLSIIAIVLSILMLANNQTFAEDVQTTRPTTSNAPITNTQRIALLVDSCFAKWEQMDWHIGQTDVLAKNNTAFAAGIKRICQAKAELFFEGYEISPFIEAESQNEVFLIVLQPSVDTIKEQIRASLPKLRLI